MAVCRFRRDFAVVFAVDVNGHVLRLVFSKTGMHACMHVSVSHTIEVDLGVICRLASCLCCGSGYAAMLEAVA